MNSSNVPVSLLRLMNLDEEINKFEKEYIYTARKTAELASQHQTSRETVKALELKLNELKARRTNANP